MSVRRFTKDPAAALDFHVDWSAWLGDDTISSSAWAVPSGLTELSASFAATSATVWLAGGAAGTRYTVSNTIGTVGGRTDRRSIVIAVDDQ